MKKSKTDLLASYKCFLGQSMEYLKEDYADAVIEAKKLKKK